MSAAVAKKRLWRRDRPVSNPYRDSLSQEIGYKLDSRTAGCLASGFAVGLLLLTGLSFLAYWMLH